MKNRLRVSIGHVLRMPDKSVAAYTLRPLFGTWGFVVATLKPQSIHSLAIGSSTLSMVRRRVKPQNQPTKIKLTTQLMTAMQRVASDLRSFCYQLMTITAAFI